MPIDGKNGRHFTEAAREAAALARRRKREHKARFPEEHEFAMVVVRAPEVPQAFGWEIRRFGHVQPTARSADTFKDPADAGRSGRAALDGILRTAAVAAE